MIDTKVPDEQWMSRALQLARRGEGRVEPNPMVGCVIVRAGRIVGEGYHRRFGGPHAEAVALKECDGKARGATAFVTLEPCAHVGKTPPCADALMAAGIVRVVIGARDPNPLVNGRGIARLRQAGIRVDVAAAPRRRSDADASELPWRDPADLGLSARELIAPFETRVVKGRPFVIAKWAQSLDGRLVVAPEASPWISGVESRRRVHLLRARVDAIVVGAGTVRSDDPMLTARDVPLKRRALRVVLDGRLSIAPRSALATTARSSPTLILTTNKLAESRAALALRRREVDVQGVRSRGGRLDLADCLRVMYERDATNVLVEGGPTLISALFAARLVDEARVFVAPRLLGGAAPRRVLFGADGGQPPANLVVRSLTLQRSGEDVEYRLRF